jgi:hypothetical protein
MLEGVAIDLTRASATLCALTALGCSFDASTRLPDSVSQFDGGPAVDSATVVTCDGQSWWNPDFPLRRALAVEAAPYAYTMRLYLDGSTVPSAQELVAQSAQSGGQDLRLVRYDGSVWEELDRHIVAFDPAGVEIRFRIQELAGFAGGAASYYLYYGNNSADAPLADLSGVYRRWHDFEGDTIGSDGSPAFNPLPVGEWQVVDDSGNRVYRANGGSRHSAQLAGLDLEDGVFEARMKVTAPDFGNANHNGFAIRVNNFIPDELDAYVPQMRGNEQITAISTYRTGSFVTTGTTMASTIEVAQWYRLRAEFAANTVNFYINDSLSASMTDAEQLRRGIGLFGFSCEVVFDDVSARDLILPEPAVAATVEQSFCP